MLGKEPTVRSRSRRTDEIRYYTSLAFLVLVALFIVWQTVAYRGLMAVFAEWQFDVFGRYRPILTYLMTMAVVAVPLYLLGFARKRSTRRQAVVPTRAARRAMRLARVLLAIALALAIIALATWGLIRALPDGAGVPVRVNVEAAGTPPTGPVTLEGEVMYDRIAALDERVWLLGRSMRFAPVVAPGAGERGSTLTYFVAFPAANPNTGAAAPRGWSGILRKGGLPGEVVRLYRYAGYRVERPYYVLFTRPDMVTWPNRMLALQFAIAALIALIGGLLQLAHARHMLRALEPVTSTPATGP